MASPRCYRRTFQFLVVCGVSPWVSSFMSPAHVRVLTRSNTGISANPRLALHVKASRLPIENNVIESHTPSKSSTQPTPVVFKALSESFGSLAMPAVTTFAVFLLTSTLTLGFPANAAVSGARMGGSFSSSPSRSSYRAPSRSSYRAPSRSSYSTPSRSSYTGGSYRSSYSPTIIAPIVRTPYYYSPPILPIYGGGLGGAVSYQRGPNVFDLLLWGGITAFFVSSIANSWKSPWSVDETTGGDLLSTTSVLGPGVSVIRMSVAVEVPNRDDKNSLLSVLDRLAATAQTGSRRGVQTLTSQVALELLRRKSSIQSAASSYKHTKDEKVAQRQFNQWSVEERSKFEQENTSKFSGVDMSGGNKRHALSSDDGMDLQKATMAVVTLVLSIQGDSTVVAKIGSLSDVEQGLQRIAADAKIDDCLIGAEILWTPEDRSEVLTRMDVVADYPGLTIV